MRLREHAITLRRERVVLRPMTEDDWGILLKWNSDPEVLYYVEENDISSHTAEQVQRIYRTVSQNAFCFITEYESKPIGECWLQRMNLERILKRYHGSDCRRIDLMIGDTTLWGLGLGTDVIGILTRFGFENERADYIFGCDIADYNPRSVKTFETNGFQIDQQLSVTHGTKGKSKYALVLSRKDYHPGTKYVIMG